MTSVESTFIKHILSHVFRSRSFTSPEQIAFSQHFHLRRCTQLAQLSDDLWILLVVLGSLSGLPLCAVGFMGAVSVDPIITFLTCAVNLCSMNQSPGDPHGDLKLLSAACARGRVVKTTDCETVVGVISALENCFA